MKTVIITRKYWGKGSLRDNEGKKCCLGFVSEAFGVLPSQTLNISVPHNLTKEVQEKLPDWLCKSASCFSDVGRATSINDTSVLSWDEKEKQLKQIFALHDIRLVFRGQR
jgi:hypothetical protein